MRARALGLLALALLGLAIGILESGRQSLTITPLAIPGGTPATLYALSDAPPGPVVVVLHGFAGSRQLMEPYALTLARAGHRIVSYDLQGHGRNPVAMSGDVTRIDGTTRLLLDEGRRVADAALALPGVDGRLAWLGHSMASDLVVRLGAEVPQTRAVVAVSMFSNAVSPTLPPNLLAIAGEWEGRLVAEGLRAVRLTDPGAGLGQTVGMMDQGTARRAVAAPNVEHVGVLYSPTALAEARDWLNAALAHGTAAPVANRGGWVLLALAAAVALLWPLSRALPPGPAPAPVPARVFWPALTVPAIAAPLLLWPVDTALLPVLVADHLALHLAVMGALALALLARAGALRGVATARAALIGLGLAAVLILGFGGLLNRYAANFWPHPGRAAIIAALALGAVAWMVADAVLTEAGRAGWGRVLAVRGALLASLGLAVALDFERLFFLILILPVIVLFLILFGTAAGWVGRRTGAPLAGGLGLGLMLAWALGVTFPLFSA